MSANAERFELTKWEMAVNYDILGATPQAIQADLKFSKEEFDRACRWRLVSTQQTYGNCAIIWSAGSRSRERNRSLSQRLSRKPAIHIRKADSPCPGVLFNC